MVPKGREQRLVDVHSMWAIALERLFLWDTTQLLEQHFYWNRGSKCPFLKGISSDVLVSRDLLALRWVTSNP
jgi:hypothetical protein